MILSHRVIDTNGREAKKGTITIPDGSNIQGKEFFSICKNATGEYLLQYDENIKSMARYTIDALMNELGDSCQSYFDASDREAHDCELHNFLPGDMRAVWLVSQSKNNSNKHQNARHGCTEKH